tara:strand:+ start:1079 stop:1465 length:387 start_codon:yes stop_codon:yes gene_type:complete
MENPIMNMPITGPSFVDALIVERDKLQSELTASNDALARANRFQELATELFADPIKAMVKSEMAAYAEDFDISAYEDEIRELASDSFVLSDHEDDIRDAISFDIIDHASDIETIVRDVLRDATIKLEV